MSEEGKHSFDKVVNEILLPVAEECRDDIEKILESNPILKSKIEEELRNSKNK